MDTGLERLAVRRADAQDPIRYETVMATITCVFRALLAACASLLVACHHPVVQPPTTPSHRPYCVRVSPVKLARTRNTLATANAPGQLALPEALLETVIKSGKNTVLYTVEVCGGTPPSGRSVQQSTGFADLDRFVDAHVAELGIDLSSTQCQTATIVLTAFDRACEPPQTLD